MRHDRTGTLFVSEGQPGAAACSNTGLVGDAERALHRRGPILPTPGRYGLLTALIASSVTTTTVVAEPISIACDVLGSPLSAKNSMNAKTVPAVRKSTTQSEKGMTPDAP
jgi:hypothetical protein